MPRRPVVSIVHCENYEDALLKEQLRAALVPLGGLSAFVRQGQRVLVKPNLIGLVPPERPATTHPAFIRALVELLQAEGCEPVVADSPAWGDIHRVAKTVGLLDVPLLALNHPRKVSMPPGSVLRNLHLDAQVLDADVVINVPKVKMHCQLVMSGAVKNLYGCISGRRKALLHFLLGRHPLRFAHLLLDVAEQVKPALTLMDGITAMDRHGPIRGQPRHLGLILAGANCTALDRALAELLKLDARSILTLEAARQRQLPGAEPDSIDYTGIHPNQIHESPFTLEEMQPVFFSLPRFVLGTLKQWRLKWRRGTC